MANINNTTNIFVMDLTVPEIIDLTATPRRRRGRLLPPSMVDIRRQARVRRAMEAIDFAFAMSLSQSMNDAADDSDDEDEDEDVDYNRAIEESQRFSFTEHQSRKRMRESGSTLCPACSYPQQCVHNYGFCDQWPLCTLD